MSPRAQQLDRGLHVALSRPRYDALGRVNYSTLKWISRSPLHYRHHLLTPAPDTDPKRLGRAVHLAVFEPERYREEVAVWDGGSRRGKDWDRFVEENDGRELLTETQNEKALAIQKAVRNDPVARRYIEFGSGEVTMLWDAPVPGATKGETLACKGRLDFDGREFRVDLKTTFDASPAAFGKQAFSLGYHNQEAWYGDGYVLAGGRAKPGVLIAVESIEPYVVQVYRWPEMYLDLGRENYRQWLGKLAFCSAESVWPAYSTETELELEFPHWAMPDNEENLEGLGLKIGGMGIPDVESPFDSPLEG